MDTTPALGNNIRDPESDGTPQAETDLHLQETIYILESLKDHFRDAQDVYVGGGIPLYYAEGDPKRVVTPDVFVVLEIPRRERRIYKLWEEGWPPHLVVEITSAKTRKEDLRKKRLYERLGVAEYILYDPLGDYLNPRLKGFRMLDGRYSPIPLVSDTHLRSFAAGLTFRIEDSRLQLTDMAEGHDLIASQEDIEAGRLVDAEEVLRELKVPGD